MSSLPILVLNSGSSSIKFSIYEAADGGRAKLYEGAVDGIGTDLGKFWIKDAEGKKLVDQTPALPTRAVAFALVADVMHSPNFPAPAAIGHRVVSGGPTIHENQRITPELIDEMERYTAFAPLHTPIAVYIMREALRLFPGYSQLRHSRHLLPSHHARGRAPHADPPGICRHGRTPLRISRHFV